MLNQAGGKGEVRPSLKQVSGQKWGTVSESLGKDSPGQFWGVLSIRIRLCEGKNVLEVDIHEYWEKK